MYKKTRRFTSNARLVHVGDRTGSSGWMYFVRCRILEMGHQIRLRAVIHRLPVRVQGNSSRQAVGRRSAGAAQSVPSV